MPVKEGNKVKVEYEGKLDDGTVFDTSEKHGPIEFQVGAKQVVPGFEKAVIGMEKGEEKNIKLEPKDAYGDVNPELVRKIPKDQIPAEAKEGSTLLMQLPNGMQVPVKVVSVDEKEATLDMNHPLAGQNLNFKLKVVDFREATDEEKEKSAQAQN